MKILQVNKFLKNNGGSETYMFQLSDSLIKLGHEVKYWGMFDSENITHDFEDLMVDNIDYNNQNILQQISSVFKTIYSYQSKRNISKVLDEFKPDIVHIHNYNFQITPSILPEIKKRGIKIVQTIHDSQMACPNHRLYNLQKQNVCTKCVKGSFNNCIYDKCFDGSLMKSLVGALESKLYHSLDYYNKYIDRFISPSNFIKDLVSYRIKKEIIVLPNFTQVSYNEKINSDNSNYYLYFGRISDEKGIMELVSIFKKTKLQLIIIGKGPLESELIKSISGVDNIQYVGAKYGVELNSFIQRAKYTILLTKAYENCPMTIIESYALNVPVISYNHSGFEELIKDGETGFLFDVNNKDKILDQLLDIEYKDVNKLKKNIKPYFDSKLSKEMHIKKIIEIYYELLSQS